MFLNGMCRDGIETTVHNPIRYPVAAAPGHRFGTAVFLCLLVALCLTGCSKSGEEVKAGDRSRAAAPIPVAVTTIAPRKVDIYATYPGRIRGAREVEVRSRIEGILLRRHYNEGALVETGELLFTINPEPFRATVKQRKAQLAKARANLNQAQEVWERVSHLYEINAVSEAERDEARAKLKTAQAGVALARANLEAAQIKLDYASVEAPLSGVTSLEEVDVGALVTPGTLLTTITQLDPVHVRFSVPAEDAMMRQKALAAMHQKDAPKVTRAVNLILPSGKTYEPGGFVDFTQSTIDPNTGTVRLRATFENANRELVPGRFVRVRIRLETRKNAIVVPNKAIADSQTQTRVFVVTEDSKAKPVAVTLGPTVADGRIIKQGLAAGDRVIIIGLGQVHPGAKVKIKPRAQLALGSAGNENMAAGAAKKSAQDSNAGETPGANQGDPASSKGASEPSR